MASPVIVYILTADEKSDRVAKVCKSFINPLFQIKVVTLDNPNNQINLDQYRVNYILNDAQKNHPSNYLIVVKDTSMTLATSDAVSDFVSFAINEARDWDLCYLCEWMDRCDQLKNVKQNPDGGAALAQTQSPHGLQTLMISPTARDMLLGTKPYRTQVPKTLGTELSTKLNQLVMAGCLKADCALPNIFVFDPSLAEDDKDRAKANQCLIPGTASYQQTTTTTTTTSWWWIFIIAVIIIALLIVCFWWYGKTPNTPKALTAPTRDAYIRT
jgi:hypothetical protein